MSVSEDHWSTSTKLDLKQYNTMAYSVNVTSYSPAVETSRIILLGIIPLVIIMTVVANGVYIVTLVKKRTLHTPSNMLLGALALSDVLVGIVANPTWMVMISAASGRYRITTAEQVSGLMMYFFILLSLLNIVTVSADRYIAIFYPFWYLAKATCKTHIKVAFAVLGISIVIFVPLIIIAAIQLALASYIYLSFIAISLTITCYCNIKIFHLIRKKVRQVNVVSNDPKHRESEQSAVPRVLQQKNNAIVIVIITVLFIICYSPSTIYFTLRFLGITLNHNQHILCSFWTVFLVLLNSFMNPVVYFYRMRSFRRAFKAIFLHRQNTNVRQLNVHSLESAQIT